MSGIYIPNMEMPKYCCHCRFESSSIHGQYCILTKKFTRLDDNEDGSKRHISCPLAEVPTHGVLWDRDKIFNVFNERIQMYRELGYKDDDFIIQELGHIQADLIAKVETVIEASTECTKERE